MRRAITLLVITAAATVAVASAAALGFSGWGAVAPIEPALGSLNTAALEGCPFVAQSGTELYFASSRAGGEGGLDIWVARRDGEDLPWGAPENVRAVNSPYDELCPAAHRNGRTFLFVSTRPGGCGGGDIYMTRSHPVEGWAPPENLGCTVNSPAGEASPSLHGGVLTFSSARPGGFAPGGTDSDIYVSTFDGVSFGAPVLAPGLNTATDDSRPNVRRDGLELFFDSNRPDATGATDLDLWTSTRATTSAPWSPPTNLGDGVNSTANDLRPSLSWDGTTLTFGSTRAGGEGSQDLYVTTRSKTSAS
jgi:Tol biopolymer transport system component